MKRDLDLVRRILLQVEQSGEDGTSPSGWSDLGDEGFEASSIQYHIQILHDAGLILADELVPGQWWPERMTWEGHEFLDAARDEAIWGEARRRVEASGGAAPFEVVRELLLRLTRERLAHPSSSPDSEPEPEPNGTEDDQTPVGTSEKPDGGGPG